MIINKIIYKKREDKFTDIFSHKKKRKTNRTPKYIRKKGMKTTKERDKK